MNKKILVTENVKNITYEGCPESEILKPKLEEFLTEEIAEKHEIIFSDGKTKNMVNLIKTSDGRYGFAFGCSKFDDNFKETLSQHGNFGTFRYKDKEVKDAIKKAINKFDLEPLINWTSGLGVFVFNFYLKQNENDS